ncbi:hypothetical protein [Cumulibacter manganitolerans]|uniref:hypothetical protein n=1 Tax=Cumulibacter manganitolerans TaxID=1884992 RepID=UPI001297B4AD|nr:hypothetical protein [Cumulibacter manganitolerans]
MQWSDLWYATADVKVAHRLRAAGDLLAFSGQVAIGVEPRGLERIVAREGVWVTTAPMPETVKDVGDDDLVRGTVPRGTLSIVTFPVVVDVEIACAASDPDDLLRRTVASGRELQRL